MFKLPSRKKQKSPKSKITGAISQLEISMKKHRRTYKIGIFNEHAI